MGFVTDSEGLVEDVKNNKARAPASITGLDRSEIVAEFEELGEPAYRADQVLEWIYRKRAGGFAQMTNLGQALRAKLETRFGFSSLEPVRTEGSVDSTRKYLFRLGDGRHIETVLIPASPALYGEPSDRRTLCVSSQVGCAYDCKFCASGLNGFARNLVAGEIVEQVLRVEELSGEAVSNIVFMGMGEPLANLTQVLKSIEIINAHWGIGIGARRMTVSTSGLAPQIRKLAEQPRQIRLAVSLHAASDEVRDRIMPVNRKYPLDTLFEALRYYKSRKKQRITFEYILIDGVNDAPEEAALLARRAGPIGAKINLIPYNTVDGLPWRRPSEARQEAFQRVLRAAGILTTLRREKGHDIDAACGQLRLREEKGGVIADS